MVLFCVQPTNQPSSGFERRQLGSHDEHVGTDAAVFDLPSPAQVLLAAVHLPDLRHAIGDVEQEVVLALPGMDVGVGKTGDEKHALPIERRNIFAKIALRSDGEYLPIRNHNRLVRDEIVRLRGQDVHIDEGVGGRTFVRQR